MSVDWLAQCWPSPASCRPSTLAYPRMRSRSTRPIGCSTKMGMATRAASASVGRSWLGPMVRVGDTWRITRCRLTTLRNFVTRTKQQVNQSGRTVRTSMRARPGVRSACQQLRNLCRLCGQSASLDGGWHSGRLAQTCGSGSWRRGRSLAACCWRFGADGRHWQVRL